MSTFLDDVVLSRHGYLNFGDSSSVLGHSLYKQCWFVC